MDLCRFTIGKISMAITVKVNQGEKMFDHVVPEFCQNIVCLNGSPPLTKNYSMDASFS